MQGGIGADGGEPLRHRGGWGVADDALPEGEGAGMGAQEISEHRDDGALDDLEAVGSAHLPSKARAEAGRERERGRARPDQTESN
jgi:hypothetical protein